MIAYPSQTQHKIRTQPYRQQAQHQILNLPRVQLKYLLLFLLIVLCCSLFYIWSRLQITNLGYDLANISRKKEELSEQNKKLVAEVANLKSIMRLDSLAKTQFQMDTPKSNQVFYPEELSKGLLALNKPSENTKENISNESSKKKNEKIKENSEKDKKNISKVNKKENLNKKKSEPKSENKTKKQISLTNKNNKKLS